MEFKYCPCIIAQTGNFGINRIIMEFKWEWKLGNQKTLQELIES